MFEKIEAAIMNKESRIASPKLIDMKNDKPQSRGDTSRYNYFTIFRVLENYILTVDWSHKYSSDKPIPIDILQSIIEYRVVHTLSNIIVRLDKVNN